MGKTINYGNADIYVSDEIAEFIEQDRKHIQAQERSDRRHVSRVDFEKRATTAQKTFDVDYVFNFVSRKLTFEKLHEVIDLLTEMEQQLIFLYFYNEMSMESVGVELGGISKMAVSKRLKKLLSKMRNLMET